MVVGLKQIKIMSITDKLKNDEINHFLGVLFGFRFVNTSDYDTDEHWVLFDEEGDEFYACSENLQFDFSTLAGIFSYMANRSKNQGFLDCQYEMRKLLGL
jgi:hypothetical protein